MASCSNMLEEVYVQGACIKIKTFYSDVVESSPKLLIALHGDSPFNNPSYHYRFAKQIAEQADNVISIGMLRPGYTDHLNRTSDGVRGKTVGDNYDDARIKQIAQAISTLKSHYQASKVILAGHSGGAAISARLVALYPNLIDEVFIVSCPCNINAWRADMYKKSNYEGFKGHLDISSPVALVGNISEETQINVLVGGKDEVTKPYLSQEYVQALKQANKQVEFALIPGGHEVFLAPQVVQAVKKSLAR